jgi:preprotein translocase subunit SecG
MGTPTVLGKITTVVAVAFMVTSFSLAVLSHHRSTTIMPVSAPAAPGSPAAPAPALPGTPAAPAPEKK